MEKQSDVILLANVIRRYNFVGISPYAQKYKKILATIFYLVMVPCFIQQIIYTYGLNNISCATFVFLLTSFVEVGFSLCCLRSACAYTYLFKSYFFNVNTFDKRMKKNGNIKEKNAFLYNIVLFVINGVHIVLILLYLPFIFFKILRQLGTIYDFYVKMQRFTTIFVFKNFCQILQERYDYLRVRIREIYSCREVGEAFLTEKQLMEAHLFLSKMTNNINAIFGTRILFMLFLTFMYIIQGLQMSILASQMSVSMSMLLVLGLMIQTFFHLVSIR